MKLTSEILKKYGACEQGIRYIERFYPDGAELIDIIRDRHISKDFLHWGKEHLTTTEEERAVYCEVCNIKNTEGFWYSQDVSDSKYVVKSKNVTKSQSIFDSSDIMSSRDICSSESVDNGTQIFSSFAIDGCSKVFKGENITSSTNICNSKMIVRSKNVIDSSMIIDSTEIIKSSNVTNSHFCQECKNIKNCLFCYKIENAEYYIFNQPVDPGLYEMFALQYAKYLLNDLSFIRDWPEDMIASDFVIPTRKFDDWFHPISSKFWKWARTLPNFDSMILYNITMLPEILMD